MFPIRIDEVIFAAEMRITRLRMQIEALAALGLNTEVDERNLVAMLATAALRQQYKRFLNGNRSFLASWVRKIRTYLVFRYLLELSPGRACAYARGLPVFRLDQIAPLNGFGEVAPIQQQLTREPCGISPNC
jgi:hypothetical protein